MSDDISTYNSFVKTSSGLFIVLGVLEYVSRHETILEKVEKTEFKEWTPL